MGKSRRDYIGSWYKYVCRQRSAVAHSFEWNKTDMVVKTKGFLYGTSLTAAGPFPFAFLLAKLWREFHSLRTLFTSITFSGVGGVVGTAQFL